MLLAAWCLGQAARSQEFDARSAVYIECTVSGKVTGQGSGAVIDAEGRLLTAKHVVERAHANNGDCRGAIGTRINPNDLRKLTFRVVPENLDIVMMQFDEHEILTFVPIPFAGLIDIPKDTEVVGYGFHPDGSPTADRSVGKVISETVDASGRMKSGQNTQKGMSGGPVLIDGRLVGIIAAESFDRQGQQISTLFVPAKQFPEDILRWLTNQDTTRRDRTATILAEQLAMNDVCTQILREQISLRKNEFPTAAQIATPLIEASSSSLIEVADYWVTVTTGPARWIDCRTGKMLKALYFPTGMMLQPERDVTIDGETRTIFLTEQGLRVFLDHEAIEPITPDIGYVFATATGVFKVCKQTDTGCSVFDEYRITEHDQHWPFLSGYQSYLRSEEPADLDRASEALREMFEYQSDPPGPFDPLAIHLNLTDLGSLPACKEREARLYTVLMRFDAAKADKGSAYLEPVRFSLCTLHKKTAYNRLERIKVVTLAAADARFRNLWAVNTIHQPTENVQRVTRALFNVTQPIVSIMKCDDDRRAILTLGRAARGSVTALDDVVAADADDALAEVSTRRHSVFRQFQITQARSPVDVFKTAPLFNDIELSAVCAGNNEITNAGEIIVDLAPLAQKLELKLFDLFNDLKTSDEYRNLGMVDPDILNKRLREGIMYRICGFHEYIVWRSILFDEIKDSELVRQAKEAMGVDLALMADHITHLIMANVFSTDTRILNSQHRTERCD
ncbi:S1 family peptidase [Paracoccus aestuariivivens]|uniref:Trypsin-like serine protease n=1 Tax=Paracoccus aestuariivivens TaxID=1820333 RepID=A0A6L6JG88_9RHOB|nr:serine protease [Paracoccus aestuariivivens]MTH80198.1 hypothetical protein [Paracoccus aestuariivivens]